MIMAPAVAGAIIHKHSTKVIAFCIPYFRQMHAEEVSNVSSMK